MDNDKIIARYNSLKTERYDVEDLWRMLERFTRPLSGRFYQTKEHDQTVNWRRREIYDGQAIFACNSLAASLQGNLVSPAAKWFDLRFAQEGRAKDDSSREWLEASSDTVYYELQQSNFNEQIAEAFYDLASFGTAVIVEEWDEQLQQIDFTSVPIREVYFEAGYQGDVKTFYRKLELTAVQIVDKFAPDGDISDLPKQVQERYESNDLSDLNRFEVVYCIWERPFDVWKDVDLTQPADPTKLPFGFKYILYESRETLGEEGGYYEMPAFVVRWRTTSGSDWGHGPGVYVLSSIMSLNQAYELTLESALKQIEPPIMTTQRGLLSDMEMFAGGVNVVGDMADLAPFPVGGDVNAGIVIMEDLRMQIRRAYYEDQLDLKESPAMTATEVRARYELMQRLLGPTLGRLQSDLLDPLIQRTFNILNRAGKIGELQGLQAAETVEIEYIGPLPRAQKSDRAASILGLLGQVATLAEVNPGMLDVIDWDEAVREISVLTGVPATVIRNKNELRAIRQERANAQAQAEQTAQRQAEGDAVQSVAAGAQAVSSLPPEAIAALQRSVPPRESR